MQNPFGPNRIEYESRPVLWFSQKSREISTAKKPIFVSGTRGSGKTSILRSLSTIHILEDANLAKQVGILPWYGVFFQLNETFSP
ncbi:CpaF/VirB11 family protein [Rhizobium leguminosarum]|nr:CpaF/VirB11 family protein [Rhizobium leguminosarum]